MSPTVPTIDLTRWRQGDAVEHARLAAEVDSALQRVGFLLVTGHDVPEGLRADVRLAARAFFALPEEVKARYAVPPGGRGWIAQGAEANAASEGTASPPDLKESFAVGADEPVGVPEIDAEWFPPNVWPAEQPFLRPVVESYTRAMRVLADDLLALLAAALDLPEDTFTRSTRHPTWTFQVNWYPPMTVVGEPLPGQFRIGPHTDFGSVTILDRQAGKGGLQVHSDEGGWEDAPFEPGAFTVNIGDLLARWTGDRWRSGRHRVLPPDPSAPQEELTSLVYFYECDHDAVVSTFPPPVGRVEYPPVVASTYLHEKYHAITVS
ncbi:MAG TPA: 2-oxoglutarate and iron-dependent oxygenase domain-containing protein [Actinomycetes bacterium]|nr:2-oxoglutarate and iron-dependent oxygenase domain-containing protein [Actinomycetes bacterium]